MAKVTERSLNNSLREKYLSLLIDTLEHAEEEVLRVGSNEICLPCVDDAGNDKFIVITVKVPNGSRDGDLYDGYSMAEDYKMKLEAKALAAEKAEAEKQKKIQKDAKKREQQAAIKAKKEANSN